MSGPRKVLHLPKVRMLGRGRPQSGIRITNIRSIKPPDPDTVKKQEEEKLRAQLQKEILSRSKTCGNSTYKCGLPVVSGRQYCAQHILQDPTAPYKQCSHQYKNGLRCPQPAPIDKEQALCFEHARSALHARQRAAAPPPPVTTTETLLHQLSHYVRAERVRTGSCASSVSVVSEPDLDPPATQPVDPFKQIDATAVNAAYSANILDCASASDSDSDSVALTSENPPSDSEPTPAEEHELWRAGVFTAEEAVSETKHVLKSLQTAYVKQMGRLRQLLQSARLNYLRNIKAEKEQYCSINAQSRSGPLTVRERRQLRKLKAYAGYRRRQGVDAVLARKLMQKRSKVNEISHNRPIPSQGRCTYMDNGYRCPKQVLPAAKHCLKHILYDRHQVLFVSCGDPRGVASCREPQPRLPLSGACPYHAHPPHYTTFSLQKDDTATEMDSNLSSDESQTDTAEFNDGGELAIDNAP